MRHVYLMFSVLGIAIPYGALLPWLLENGLNIGFLLEQAAVNPISIFAWLDVVVAALCLLTFIATDSKTNQVKGVIYPILGTLAVGVSLGLPLYLYIRERQFYLRTLGREVSAHGG